MDNILNGKCECGYLIQDCCCRAGEPISEQILKRHQKIHDENILGPTQAVLDAMQEYTDLCQSANMERIRELESLLQLSEAKVKLNYQDAKNLEGKIKEASEKLNEVFLPKNLECDGPYCIGCWKDVVREVLNKLNPDKK